MTVDLSKILPHAEIIGADGVHVGTLDHVDGDRLKLTKTDSVDGQHHFIDKGLIATIHGASVRLSANADVAVSLEDEDQSEHDADSDRLDEGLAETFPASDPVSATDIS